MAKIIIHNESLETVNELRLLEDFKLSHKQRMEKAFKLMRLSILFSNVDKANFKRGIIFKNE